MRQLGIEYVDGTATRQVMICAQCECMLLDDDFDESVALHRDPKSKRGESIAEVAIVHGGCARDFINQRKKPRDIWRMAQSGPPGEAYTHWGSVDMEGLRAAERAAENADITML